MRSSSHTVKPKGTDSRVYYFSVYNGPLDKARAQPYTPVWENDAADRMLEPRCSIDDGIVNASCARVKPCRTSSPFPRPTHIPKAIQKRAPTLSPNPFPRPVEHAAIAHACALTCTLHVMVLGATKGKGHVYRMTPRCATRSSASRPARTTVHSRRKECAVHIMRLE